MLHTLQRAAIKKQLFLNTFDFTPPLDVNDYARLSVSFATSLDAPLAATDNTMRDWFEFNSTTPLSFQGAASTAVTSSGTYLAQVRP